MPLARRWFGTMLIGAGLMLFGVSGQSWQVWSSFAVIASVVLTLPKRFTDGSAL